MKTVTIINKVKELLLALWILVLTGGICLELQARSAVATAVPSTAVSAPSTSTDALSAAIPRETASAPVLPAPAWHRTMNFYLVSDLGRNGYYDQKSIAEQMGRMASEVDPECVFAAGDVHHFEGVRSIHDPLWMTNFEQIYSHPDLMLPWHPVLGNHEYRGTTDAVIDYSQVSRRWEMPARYYTKVYRKKNVSIRFVMLDTTPLIDKYRQDHYTYPDAGLQDIEQQLIWADSVLTAAHEDWVVVIGHHPIYAETPKVESERRDLQQRLDPLLRRHAVDVYACGHIHNFQHLRLTDSTVDYVVNSSGSLSRKVRPVADTRFCSDAAGFSVISVEKDELNVHFVHKDGTILYTVKHTKPLVR